LWIAAAFARPPPVSAERGCSVFAELIRDIILGLVAGLITTISISMSATDAQTNLKIRRLREWLSRKKLPKPFRSRCTTHQAWLLFCCQQKAACL
jgi:hypothetical protein